MQGVGQAAAVGMKWIVRQELTKNSKRLVGGEGECVGITGTLSVEK